MPLPRRTCDNPKCDRDYGKPKIFIPIRQDHRFCCDACRFAAFASMRKVCPHCGKEIKPAGHDKELFVDNE
jgi:uncharacterized Zn-finger protein